MKISVKKTLNLFGFQNIQISEYSRIYKELKKYIIKIYTFLTFLKNVSFCIKKSEKLYEKF